ncbi:MAG: AMP-binding protein [Betaproteobacteria bacterium]|nr:AMP-binding protein [Betaproteobacteria bacterium]
MPERLFRTLAAHPRRPALSGAGSGINAGELLRQIETLSARLANTRVLAVLADNGPAWVALDLAALHAGVTHLPLPGFFSPAQMTHALESAGSDHVLTDAPERILALGLGFTAAGEIAGLASLRRTTPARALPAGTAKISFTSGSTGQPRGVCLAAAGLMDTAESIHLALDGLSSRSPGRPKNDLAPTGGGSGDFSEPGALSLSRHLACLPLPLLLENVAGVYAALLHGAEAALPSLAELGWRGMSGFDPACLMRSLRTRQPASLILVPELLKAWTQTLETAGEYAPAWLRLVAVGGAKVAPDLLARADARGIPAYEGYGLTECGSVLSLNLPGAERPASAGRPLAHVRVRVDERGEIHAAGRLALGYLGETPFPTRPDGLREIATGDLGRLDADGFLHLEGRRKNLLITAYGRNVSPEWVEAALTAQPEILHALAAGEAQPRLAALIAPMPGSAPEAVAQAVARANATLPDYARIHTWAAVPPFLAADGLATGNGRPLRAVLLARHAPLLETLFTKENSHVVL